MWYYQAVSRKNGERSDPQKYESVSLDELRQGRLGKHHDMVKNIVDQLKELPDGQAIKIPLDSIGDLSKANLRSVIMRAAEARQMHFSTYSDRDNFYVWNRTAKTAEYERKRPKSAKSKG